MRRSRATQPTVYYAPAPGIPRVKRPLPRPFIKKQRPTHPVLVCACVCASVCVCVYRVPGYAERDQFTADLGPRSCSRVIVQMFSLNIPE